jgi:4-hydroxybenzoate polyprenyltransferase
VPELDASTLVLGTIFGAVGLGYFVYGKRQGSLVPLVCGLLLMVVPYFISSTVVLVGVCATIAVVPYFARD